MLCSPASQRYPSLFRGCCGSSGKSAKAFSVNRHQASYRLMYSNFHASMHPPVRLHLRRKVYILVVIGFLLKIFMELFLGLELRKTFVTFECILVFFPLSKPGKCWGGVFLSFKCVETHFLVTGGGHRSPTCHRATCQWGQVVPPMMVGEACM